ncbi:hypothetical protein PHACT_09365 [Pseudohongiella acticola]|jgi:Type II secretion system (T2SS), protein M subtype b|uniref:MSHA biogenesis protein MshJ n=1 Tax=Pseudohongiella acticola TaxID=1524254 RepID=A0A1E8CLG9_9GAMM|nr:GspMb/PilO family protein [Pseudohongiella acticola]OFE13321.1 hypothetical protein PHACT_09365 [Pseudohongiella acticola]
MLSGLRSLTPREKNILRLALVLALIIALSNGLPVVRDVYSERAQAIESLRLEIDREQRLLNDTDLWQQRRQEIDQQLQNLEARLFTGNANTTGSLPTVPVLAANIQRLVRQIAQDTGITITSTSLAESMEADGWLLVEQTLAFNLDNQSNTLDFLARLDASEPWLAVNYFSMSRGRNMFSGEITVVGFSRETQPNTAGD